MKKQQYYLEFALKGGSVLALWSSISTAAGLEKWFADKADMIDKNLFSFEWNEQSNIAEIKNIKENEYIRFHWVEDKEKTFFEFKITKNELTGEITLTITDFAAPDDIEDETHLWKSSVDALCQYLRI